MKLFNWGKTEEQKEIEKREAFEKNLKELEKELKETTINFKNAELFNKLMLDPDGNIFSIREFSLPTYELERNDCLQALIKNRHMERNTSGWCSIFYTNDFLNYCVKSRNRFINLRNQFKIFGYKLVKDDE